LESCSSGEGGRELAQGRFSKRFGWLSLALRC